MEQLEKIFYDPKQGYSNARELFQKANQKGLKLNYDEVKKWYEEQPVNQIFRKPQVERFNYTLLQKIKKYMTKNDSVVYIDVLDDILLNYNNTVHSSIRHTC